MPMERRVVEAALGRKGFEISRRDHNFFAFRMKDGQKTTVWTKTSYGSGYKTLSDSLLSAMARQCHLTRGQFADLVECPLSREACEAILRERKLLPTK